MEGHVVARAFRNIPSAQELYLDYSTMGHPEDEHIIIEKCACGTAFCRKQIRSRDWKSPALQKKIRGSFFFCFTEKNKGFVLKTWDRYGLTAFPPVPFETVWRSYAGFI